MVGSKTAHSPPASRLDGSADLEEETAGSGLYSGRGLPLVSGQNQMITMPTR